jgi:hypothetical protein
MTGAAGIATMSATEIAVADNGVVTDSGVVTDGNIAAVVADDAFIIMDMGGKPFRSRIIDQCKKVVAPAGLLLNGFAGRNSRQTMTATISSKRRAMTNTTNM